MTLRHSKRWYFWAKLIAKTVAVVMSFLPALIATIVMFPDIVVKKSESTLSGVFLAVSLIAMFPLMFVLWKQIKTPSATMICTLMLVILAVVFSLMYYAEQSTRLGLMVVSITASAGNIISTIAFKLAHVWDDLFKHCGEVYINNG
jgi:hypothetical protein